MKVIFCAYDGENIINGVNAWLCKLLPSLVNAGFEVHVIFILWAEDNNCAIFNLLADSGIKCVKIPYPHYTESQVRWILKYVKQEVPTAFIPGDMLPGLYASKWIRKSGIPTIGILHNDDDFYGNIIDVFIHIKAT
jgi:colanic acid/amylovoran biosynthesis glycosyltransferase